jgi:hypothetical protein
VTSAVTQIHPWIVHISRKGDEWTGLCGATGEKAILADNVDFVLPGYKACESCLAEQEKEKRHGKGERYW